MDLVTQGYIAWWAFRGPTAQDRRGCCGDLVWRQRAVNVSPHFPPTSPDTSHHSVVCAYRWWHSFTVQELSSFGLALLNCTILDDRISLFAELTDCDRSGGKNGDGS